MYICRHHLFNHMQKNINLHKRPHTTNNRYDDCNRSFKKKTCVTLTFRGRQYKHDPRLGQSSCHLFSVSRFPSARIDRKSLNKAIRMVFFDGSLRVVPFLRITRTPRSTIRRRYTAITRRISRRNRTDLPHERGSEFPDYYSIRARLMVYDDIIVSPTTFLPSIVLRFSLALCGTTAIESTRKRERCLQRVSIAASARRTINR